MAKSHRIDGLLEVVKNQLLFFSKPKSCIIIVTNGENNLSSNKKIELHHLLSKLSEELENYEVTFVHPAMH